MKNRKILLIFWGIILFAGLACGSETAISPTPTTLTTPPVLVQPTSPPAAETGSEVEKTSGCEDFFQFCVTSTISGATTATATAGVGSSFENNCTAWAAGGEPRILELPLMFAAGENKITVALTRLGAYTGPGRYELTPVVTTGQPDTFPAIEVAGRTFSNGAESTAVVTIAADGSGSVQAMKLAELASVQVSNPDPSARIDFAMQWTCQQEQ